jgi:signal transduction histidine kinase
MIAGVSDEGSGADSDDTLLDLLPDLDDAERRELDWLLNTVVSAGLELVAIHSLCANSPTCRVTHCIGEWPLPDVEPLAGSVVELAIDSRRTTQLDRASAFSGDAPSLWNAGYQGAVVVPLWHGSEVAGALVAATRNTEAIPREVASGVELVAVQITQVFHRADIEENHLLHSEMARLEQLKRDFVHTASHELRTPLTVIRTAAHTLQRRWTDVDADTRQDLLRLLVDNAAALERVVERLLEADRAENGFFSLRRTTFDLRALANTVLSRLSPLLEAHNVMVEADAPVWVAGDPVLIDRAVENLVSNAARHTPRDTTITVTAASTGETAELAVADDGPGIAMDDVPHLSAAFFRGASSATRAPRGLGLGLTLVARILNAHDTRLEIDRSGHGGARFAFHLPLAEAPEPTPRSRI